MKLLCYRVGGEKWTHHFVARLAPADVRSEVVAMTQEVVIRHKSIEWVSQQVYVDRLMLCYSKPGETQVNYKHILLNV